MNAVELGTDALGFNFYPESPRYIEPVSAKALIRQLPPFVSSVALLVNPLSAEVEAAIDSGCDLLQFHGDESNEFCRAFGHSFIKVISVREPAELERQAAEFVDARAILLDAYVEGMRGGTGQVIDWQRLPELSCPVILAGGLTPENVSDAIKLVRPYAVDVSSGVEIVKGKKDVEKMRAFVNAVREAS